MRYLLLSVLTFAACATPPAWAVDPDAIGTPDGRLAAKIVRAPHDPDHHQQTSKVFHHVYAADGRLLTKGLGGEFGHHRGLFLGWNQLSWNGKRYDFWHCNHGETQRFRAFLPDSVSLGWQAVEIDWCTADDERVLTEHRAVRARDLADDTIALDFVVDLRPHAHAVRLAGDPQHAGQQFRALQLFAEADGPKVDYLRPATAVAHANDVWTGCDWIAAVLPLPDGDVTVLRLEHPGNPRPVTWSTRAYGRFGATFDRTIPVGGQLIAGWTYVIALGRRDAAWCERMAGTLP